MFCSPYGLCCCPRRVDDARVLHTTAANEASIDHITITAAHTPIQMVKAPPLSALAQVHDPEAHLERSGLLAMAPTIPAVDGVG